MLGSVVECVNRLNTRFLAMCGISKDRMMGSVVEYVDRLSNRFLAKRGILEMNVWQCCGMC